MNVDVQHVRRCLKDFDFKRLFIEELNWSICRNSPVDLDIKGSVYRCSPFAEMGGMVVFLVTSQDGRVPAQDARKAVEHEIRKQVHEHILIFIDDSKTRSMWQWVKHEQGTPTAVRDHEFSSNQPGDSLMQKLNGIAFDIAEFDANGAVSIIKVTQRVATSFDVEKVTKRFYEEFKKEHDSFCKVLKGLESQDEVDWYASVMLNRLMFIYFIQKKGFLDGDTDYLSRKLKSTKAVGANKYYRELLVPLFFEGFAKEEKERLPEVKQLLGAVPYLNGGIFMPHKLEAQYGAQISIADSAFERLFAFFDRYNWHLDYRPLRSDNEINPDVLGYIFEKYINQKQMGAYYTKEDITDYICKNTIIPFLFDKLESLRYEELHPFPLQDVEAYIYGSVKQDDYLPTETDREYQARMNRYQQVKDDFAAGKIAGINDFITYNLDIRKFAEDWANGISNPVTLRAFYFECLKKITVLDPTVGSGAFLFAALNILEPIYEICLDKLKELGGSKYPDFAEELNRIADHPNRKYYVFKSIIINNLFGVDIMEEAVEICKLRLFLKLVAQVDDVKKIEPLPDIDFNIYTGNTLVGYASYDQTRRAVVGTLQGRLDMDNTMDRIDRHASAVDRAFHAFRVMQTKVGLDSRSLAEAKSALRDDLKTLEAELNRYLAQQFGVDVEKAAAYDRWAAGHQPFHWFVDFYGIMKGGGFDVIVGNPPYVEYSKVVDVYTVLEFETEKCGDLYALMLERALYLAAPDGRTGFIVPLSCFSVDGFSTLQQLYYKKTSHLYVSNWSGDAHPSKLFVGVDKRLEIVLAKKAKVDVCNVAVSKYLKWYAEERPVLFNLHPVYYSFGKELPLDTACSSLPKISVGLEFSILKKLWLMDHLLSDLVDERGDNRIYYTRKVSFFLQFLDFVPSIQDGKGQSRNPSELKVLPFRDVNTRDLCLACLSTSLFYWYNIVRSDCRNLNKREIYSMPIPSGVSSASMKRISNLLSQLMQDYRKNSYFRTVDYAKIGSVTVQYFNFRPSKPIIDAIEKELASYYGLSDEEVNFILNYDIKYRLGKDNDNDQNDD